MDLVLVVVQLFESFCFSIGGSGWCLDAADCRKVAAGL